MQVTIRLPPLAVSAAANDDENENVSDDDATNSRNLRSPDYDDDDLDMKSSPYDAGSSPHYSPYSETRSNFEGDDNESNENRAMELHRTASTSNSRMYEDTSSETSSSEADNTSAQDTTTTNDDDNDIDTTGDTHTTDGQDDDDNTSTSTSPTMSITDQQQLQVASALPEYMRGGS